MIRKVIGLQIKDVTINWTNSFALVLDLGCSSALGFVDDFLSFDGLLKGQDLLVEVQASPKMGESHLFRTGDDDGDTSFTSFASSECEWRDFSTERENSAAICEAESRECANVV